MPQTVRLLAFAGARDAIGAHEIEVPLEACCTSAALLSKLCEAFPRLSPHRQSLRLAINGSYALADDLVRSGDEVAIIPPVSGG